jgi:hypothetical protein
LYGALVAVVDVLSFTTSVTVAADRGITVLPYRWRDSTAVQYAEQHAAALAVGRSEAGADGPGVPAPSSPRSRISVPALCPRRLGRPRRRTEMLQVICPSSCTTVPVAAS